MNTDANNNQNSTEPVVAIATAEEVLAAARELRKQAQNPNFATTGSCEVHGDLSSGTAN